MQIAENTTVHAEDRKPEEIDTVIDDRKVLFSAHSYFACTRAL